MLSLNFSFNLPACAWGGGSSGGGGAGASWDPNQNININNPNFVSNCPFGGTYEDSVWFYQFIWIPYGDPGNGYVSSCSVDKRLGNGTYYLGHSCYKNKLNYYGSANKFFGYCWGLPTATINEGDVWFITRYNINNWQGFANCPNSSTRPNQVLISPLRIANLLEGREMPLTGGFGAGPWPVLNYPYPDGDDGCVAELFNPPPDPDPEIPPPSCGEIGTIRVLPPYFPGRIRINCNE